MVDLDGSERGSRLGFQNLDGRKLTTTSETEQLVVRRAGDLDGVGEVLFPEELSR